MFAFRKLMLCWWGGCQTFKTQSDDTHLWGECSICGKKSGLVSREAVRPTPTTPTIRQKHD